MINSRKLEELHPTVEKMAREMIRRLWDEEQVAIIVTSTYRDHASQNALYAIGRTVQKNRRPVTNAKGGQSYHNYRVAFDIVPLRYGKPVWGTTGEDLKLWKLCGKIGKEVGLEWAGDWGAFKEFPHFQFTNGLTLKDFQAGKTLPKN